MDTGKHTEHAAISYTEGGQGRAADSVPLYATRREHGAPRRSIPPPRPPPPPPPPLAAVGHIMNISPGILPVHSRVVSCNMEESGSTLSQHRHVQGCSALDTAE
ncbi:hypothetical protein PAMP_023299 [Pampus punctatissimus]